MKPYYITDGYGKRKFIGRLENNTFRTWRSYEKHFFRKHKGWAIDSEVLQDESILFYVVNETEGKKRDDGSFEVNPSNYTASRADFLVNGIKMNMPGHGEQICLPLIYWRKEESA